MPRIVVLGTGTGVGKTYFTVALARALGRGRTHGPVVALKPIETGFSPKNRPRPLSDAERLTKASTLAAEAAHPLFRFREPLSPHLAAHRENRAISIRKVVAWARGEEDAVTLHDTTIPWVILETAGGALSPLTTRRTNADLARALDPAIWILVAPDALGVLHDVRATLIALRHVAREPDFVVLSAARARDASTGTNAAELSRLGITEPIATLPRGGHSHRALARLVAALRDRARSTMGRSRSATARSAGRVRA